MSGKPKLHYTNGRGRMESVRWLLAAAGVEFEEEFLETRAQYEALLQDGALLFEQLPLVEIDGMKLVQTKAILQYIAAKYNLYGNDLKERAFIDMYVGATSDLMELLMFYPFIAPEKKEGQLNNILSKAKNRYFPVYEKILKHHGEKYLVGNQLTWADVHLLEAILMVEERCADILTNFPLLKSFRMRISEIPTIKSFLQPESQRKPMPDEECVQTVLQIFHKVLPD